MTRKFSITRTASIFLAVGLVGSIGISDSYLNKASANNLFGNMLPTVPAKKKNKSTTAMPPAMGQMLNSMGAMGAANGMPPEFAQMFNAIASGDPNAIQAFQSKFFGAVLKGITDDIEKNKANEAVKAAVSSGQGGTETFTNSEGQEVTLKTSVKEYKSAEGRTCRDVSTEIERGGKIDSEAGGTATDCQTEIAGSDPKYVTAMSPE